MESEAKLSYPDSTRFPSREPVSTSLGNAPVRRSARVAFYFDFECCDFRELCFVSDAETEACSES